MIPDQPWLDGFSVEKGIIRQFVAMPLGAGYTVEEQLSGLAEHGGLQILVYPMRAERYERWKLQHGPRDIVCNIAEPAHEMGLAPGGMMRQDVFRDPYGADAWETTAYSRCFVHLINAVQYAYVTGKQPPTMPPTARKYTEAGLPWFSYYADDLVALEAAEKLAAMDSVAGTAAKRGVHALPENEPVEVDKVIQVGKRIPEIRDGKW